MQCSKYPNSTSPASTRGTGTSPDLGFACMLPHEFDSEAMQMTTGVGGSTFEAELARMRPMRDGVVSIEVSERLRRLEKAQRLMREQGVAALYLDV